MKSKDDKEVLLQSCKELIEISEKLHNIIFEKDLVISKQNLSLSNLFQATVTDITQAVNLISSNQHSLAATKLTGLCAVFQDLHDVAKHSSQQITRRQNRAILTDYLVKS